MNYSIFAAIIFTVFTSVSFAEKNEKLGDTLAKRLPSQAPAPTQTWKLFDGSVEVDRQGNDSGWGDSMRFYDKKHKVVCYSFLEQNNKAVSPQA